MAEWLMADGDGIKIRVIPALGIAPAFLPSAISH
jgi:hypothetical protein